MASRSCVARAKQSLETRLVDAVRSGDVHAVRQLLNKGANVNAVVSSGETAIGVAAQAGDVTILRALLEYDGNQNTDNEEVRKSKCQNACDYDCSTIGHKNTDNGEAVRKCHSGAVDNERTSSNVISTSGKNNCGYFVVYHDDVVGEQDENENPSFDEEGRTPEGMEQLEWDVEVREGEEVNEHGGTKEEEVWACQYRWYADILDKTRCHAAVAAQDSGLDVRLGRRKCEVNLQDVHGCAAVHYAASHGHLDALQLLIEAGCQVDVCDAASQTALHLAAANGHTAVVELLLACGQKTQVNLETGDSRRMAPLHFAALRGHSRTCAALLAHGAHVNALDSCDRTPLYLAVARQHLHTARLLLRHGANVNIEEIHGYTAMCEAVWSKNVAMVGALVSGAGGGAAAAGGIRLCPAHQLLKYAVLHRHAAMVALLLPLPPHAANVNACDETGDTPLMLAARTNQLHVASLLLKHGQPHTWESLVANLDETFLKPTKAGRTLYRTRQDILKEGVLYGSISMSLNGADAHYIEQNATGAKANAVNAVSGCTPLLAAVESLSNHQATMVVTSPLATAPCCSFEAMVRLLLAYGADLDHCAGDYTPLTKLIVLNKFSMAAFLIRIGADVNKCTKMGDYVFDNLVLARNFKQFTLVQMIVFAGYKLSRKRLDQLAVAAPKRATIDAWLQQTWSNVWPLTHLCRLAIRKQIGPHTGPQLGPQPGPHCGPSPLDALLIPNLLKRFIQMEEYQVEDDQQPSAAAATTSSSLFI